MTSPTGILAQLRDPDGAHWCTACHTAHGDADWACPADGAELLLGRNHDQ